MSDINLGKFSVAANVPCISFLCLLGFFIFCLLDQLFSHFQSYRTFSHSRFFCIFMPCVLIFHSDLHRSVYKMFLFSYFIIGLQCSVYKMFLFSYFSHSSFILEFLFLVVFLDWFSVHPCLTIFPYLFYSSFQISLIPFLRALCLLTSLSKYWYMSCGWNLWHICQPFGSLFYLAAKDIPCTPEFLGFNVYWCL